MSTIPVLAFPEDASFPQLRRRRHPVIQYIKVLSRSTFLATALLLVIFRFLLKPALDTTVQRRFALQNFVYQRLKALHYNLRMIVKSPPLVNVTYNGKNMIDRTVSTSDILIEEARENEFALFKRESKVKSSIATTTGDNHKEVRFSDDTKGGASHSTPFSEINDKANITSNKLNESMKNLKNKLQEIKVAEYKQLSTSGFISGDPEMNSLFFHVKQLKTYLEVATAEPPREMLFKKPLSHIQVGRNKSMSYKFNYLDILNDNLDEIKQALDR